MKHRAQPRTSLRRAATSGLLASLIATGAPFPRAALAGPEGARVVRGQATVEKLGDTTVIRASNRSILKFSSFDIGAGETVQFVQPNAQSSVLNRIDSARPTQIEGALVANGRVYLVNRAGVYFGTGAQVNVGQLVAAAGKLSNADFLSGRDHFTDLSGEIRNAGSIDADVVKLVGASVANSGRIDADGGWIAMASGEDVLLGQKGSRLYVKIAKPSPGDPAKPGVVQSGELSAQGGGVTLAGGDVLGLAILHSGSTQADEIRIAGGKRSGVDVGGTLDASNATPGGVGGRIEVTGARIALRGADLDASGDAGGGVVLVGGDFQGHGALPTADITYVDADSRIHADALGSGDGGRVVVWADGVAGFYGEIGARGGALGGDGGLVEVSGKQHLLFRGDVDTQAPFGETGSLLLDPVDLTIASGTGDGDADGTDTFKGSPSGVTGSVLFADTAPTTIFQSELEGLSASTNIVLQATGNLVMQDLANNQLRLPTTGSVSFTGNTSFQMDPSDLITTEGASLSITGGTLTLGNLSTRGNAGNLAGGGISLNATGAGDLTLHTVNSGTANTSIQVANGSILDDGNTATRVTAATLLIGANGNNASIGSALAPIGTNLGTTATSGALIASATTGSGGIFFSEADSLLIGSVNGGTTKTIGLTSEIGPITATAASNLINGNTLTLTTLAPNLTTGAGIGATAIPIRSNLTGALNATTASNGNIVLAAGFAAGQPTTANPMRVGTINAGTGAVTLTANSGIPLAQANAPALGSILDDGNTSTRITAGTLSMNALQNGASVGTTANPIGTNLGSTLGVTASSGTGTIAVSEANGLVLGTVNGGAPALGATLKNVSLTAEAGSITGSSSTPNLVSGNTATLTANDAGASIGTAGIPIRSNLMGPINVTAQNGAGSVVLSSGFLATTSATPLIVGTIAAGPKNVTLTGNTGLLATAQVNATDTARRGSILDDGDPNTLITANALSMTANLKVTPLQAEQPKNFGGATIGQTNFPIGTNVSTLTATSVGAISVDQPQGGDLTIGPVSSTGLASAQINFGTPQRPILASVLGFSGGVSIRNDAGALLVNGPITTFAGSTTFGAVGPGSIELDSPDAIEFNTSSLTSGGNLFLNTNVPVPPQPALATIYVRPGTSGDPVADRRDLTLTATNGSFEMGEGQTLSVPGTLTINAPNGTPAIGGTPFVPGTITIGDVNALDLQLNGQRGEIKLRQSRTGYLQDGSIRLDGGVDVVANTIALNFGASSLSAVGSGPPATFSTPSGAPVAGAPPNSRFGRPVGTTPLTPADFVGTGGAAANQILDLQGSATTTNGTPDAVAPLPYTFRRSDEDLTKMNATADVSLVWGADVLAFLRCSPAPGDDPDDVPVTCLGYDAAQQNRDPFATPEGVRARARYRGLLAERDLMRSDLATAWGAYRAQAPDEVPSGADFRAFVEENAFYGRAADDLTELRNMLDAVDAMLGSGRTGAAAEVWQQQLLQDFTPNGMTPSMLYEATGAGSGKVDTVDAAPAAAGALALANPVDRRR